MMAVLNSRVKLVSNAPRFEGPGVWNEAVDSIILISPSAMEAQDVVFRVESERDGRQATARFPSVPGTIR